MSENNFKDSIITATVIFTALMLLSYCHKQKIVFKTITEPVRTISVNNKLVEPIQMPIQIPIQEQEEEEERKIPTIKHKMEDPFDTAVAAGAGLAVGKAVANVGIGLAGGLIGSLFADD